MIEFTFYDNEATGISVRHDQVTQFAGVTCDSNFNIKDRVSLFIRLLPYVVPHPQALHVTHKQPEDLTNPKLPTEFESASEISRFLTPAKDVTRIFVTYNGIKYDDEILRTTLFRNLLDPYFNTSKASVKIDLLDIMRFIEAARPGTLIIPVDDAGNPSFRLEKICPANGIRLNAHDALHDSVATMELFKLAFDKAPDLVRIAIDCGNPEHLAKKIETAKNTDRPLIQFTSFGKADFAPVFFVASDNRKKHLALDLRNTIDTSKIDEIESQLYVPESPFRVIRTNKAPILMTEDEAINCFSYTDVPSVAENIDKIKLAESFGHACKSAISSNTFTGQTDPTSEERIYGKNISFLDKQRMKQFRSAQDWLTRSQIPFDDERLRDFSARIILEALMDGRAMLPPEIIANLAVDCSQAYARPFAGNDNRFTTISSVLSDGADDRWIEWAKLRYGDHPVFDQDIAADLTINDKDQMAFGF
jgi:exodeoxyribonuclease I